MAQKSITSFFTKAPPKPVSAKTDIASSPVREKSVSSDEGSPVKIKKTIKRQRIDSDSDSQSSSPKKKNSETSPPSIKKKNSETSPPSAKKKNSETSPPSAKKNVTFKVKIVSNKKTPKKKANESKSTKMETKTSSIKTEQSDSDELNKENESLTKSHSSDDESMNQDHNDSISDMKEVEKELKNETKSEKNTETKSKPEKKTKTEPKPEKKTKTEPKTEKKTKTESEPKNKTKIEPEAKKNINSFFTNKTNDAKTDDNKSTEYDPTKAKYHPINDAIWKENEKVPYLALARTLEEIEKISARLKIVDTLSNYFRSVIVLSPNDLLPSIYLCLNKLAPAYEGVELGVAENTLMKAIAQSTGRSMAQLKSECNALGDLGVVAEQSRSNQRMMFRPAALTVRMVFDKLKEIAQMTGHAVISKKVDKIQSLFVACRHSEAKYLIRSLAGKLRIGLAEQSVLQALAQACSLTPPRLANEEQILDASKGLSTEQFKGIVDEQALILKTAYCECPNYDLVVPVILEKGVMELPLNCKLTPGIPLKPMLAHPTKGVSEVLQRFENLKFTCEWKYDGERAQIHLPSVDVDGVETADIAKATIYSRNQENNTSKYPDVLTRLKNAIKDSVKSCVIDCEAVAWDKEKKQILPFQILSTRKRKDAKESDIKVAVCLFMFDLLYLNGESLVKIPFVERRKLLKENFIETEGEWHFATSLDCSTTEDIQEFLEESIRGNCEGLMVKTLEGKDATYEIAKRSRNWLKLKKDYIEGIGDTIDAVVLGGYLGRGKRAGVYGGFLLACYDKDSDEYQTLCKIGTGFSDEDLQTHSKSLKEHIIESPRNYYRYDPTLEPDHWFAPAQVWEIKCGDLSLSPIHRAAVGIVDPEKGISLRFPRFIRLRDDKTAEEATSAHQIAELYSNQDQVKNQANNTKLIEEDFY